ncbi:MAG: type VI secretion system-associated FHA domain protein TagH [Comamonadaceae bacterium]|nr:MAG: type VI secretion system-associated FHA domain protein TagH [Comamonadaceae bacterium]
MPHIILDLISLDGKPLNGLSRRFEGEGGTIGRDEGNTLSLPDSHRRVSRLHAAIGFPGGVATITNSSAVLPISVGGMQLEGGQAMPLLPGMQLEIGPYVLGVRSTEASALAAPAPAQGAASPLHPPVAAPVSAPHAPWAPPPGAGVANLDSLFAPAGAPAAAAFQDLGIAPIAPGSSAQRTGSDPFGDLLAGLSPAAPPPAPAAPMPAPPPPHVPVAISAPAPVAAALPVDDPLAGLLGPGTALSSPAFPPASASDPFAGLGIGGAGAVSAPDPFAGAAASASAPEAIAPGSQLDPFAALGLGPGAGAPNALATGMMAPSPPPPAVVIPEDFNPFELPSAAARNTADPLSSLMDPGGAPTGEALPGNEQSIDVLFGATGASHALTIKGAPGSDFLGGPGGGSLLEPLENSNPMAMFGDAPAPDGMSRAMRDDLAEVGGAYQPPRALDPGGPFGMPGQSPPPAQPHFSQAQHGQAQPMPSYPADELTRAFLAGANLQPSALPQGLTPEIMAVVGSVLHAATTGAIGMLAIRANIKREVQANVTIISSEANNPLKFLPDAETVLQQLLGKKIPGFMGPDEAMKDAFNDLRAHEAGVIAGTRAALGEVLNKFDPAVLGERLVGGSLLERALPAVRKTKLWDLYLERYAHIRREAEDDFQSIFGRAFVEAYERETARMKKAGR